MSDQPDDVERRRADRDPDVYAKRRARARRRRRRIERDRFDPAPPGDDDWTVPDRDGLVRLPTTPSAVGDVLGDLVAQRQWSDRLQSVGLFTRWAEVVGPDLEPLCRPVRLAGGVLTVAVADPGWATQVRYLSRQVILNANRVLGQPLVTQLQVVVRPD